LNGCRFIFPKTARKGERRRRRKERKEKRKEKKKRKKISQPPCATNIFEDTDRCRSVLT
jgi:hypothetical protein